MQILRTTFAPAKIIQLSDINHIRFIHSQICSLRDCCTNPKAMFRLLTVSLFISVFCSSAVFAQSNSAQDTTRIYQNEAGINTGVFQYNSFAPEVYLQDFSVSLSKGIFYKFHIRNQAIRAGISSSDFNYNHDLSKTHFNSTYMQDSDTFSIAGKTTGMIYSLGYERELYTNNYFRFYVGVDLSIADYSFSGNYTSASQKTQKSDSKNMFGAGVNPLLGCSITLFDNFVISAEANFENWLIRERTRSIYTLPEPAETLVTTHRFVSAPNPLKTISVSVLF